MPSLIFHTTTATTQIPQTKLREKEPLYLTPTLKRIPKGDTTIHTQIKSISPLTIKHNTTAITSRPQSSITAQSAGKIHVVQHFSTPFSPLPQPSSNLWLTGQRVAEHLSGIGIHHIANLQRAFVHSLRNADFLMVPLSSNIFTLPSITLTSKPQLPNFKTRR